MHMDVTLFGAFFKVKSGYSMLSNIVHDLTECQVVCRFPFERACFEIFLSLES